MISIRAILLPDVPTLKGPTRAPVFLDTREMAYCNVKVCKLLRSVFEERFSMDLRKHKSHTNKNT